MFLLRVLILVRLKAVAIIYFTRKWRVEGNERISTEVIFFLFLHNRVKIEKFTSAHAKRGRCYILRIMWVKHANVRVCKGWVIKGKHIPMLGYNDPFMLSPQHVGRKRERKDWRREVSRSYSCSTAPPKDFLVKLAKLCRVSHQHCHLNVITTIFIY